MKSLRDSDYSPSLWIILSLCSRCNIIVIVASFLCRFNSLSFRLFLSAAACGEPPRPSAGDARPAARLLPAAALQTGAVRSASTAADPGSLPIGW